MPLDSYDVGDAPRLVATITDDDGASLPDPLPDGSAVVWGILEPDGTRTTYTLGEHPELVRDGDDFTVRWTLRQVGVHYWGVRVTGLAEQAEERPLVARAVRSLA